jgi:hypothetical protein
MKSSFHRVIPFLPFLLSYLRLPSPKLDPILDSNSNWNDLLCPFINSSARTTQTTQPLYCREGLFTCLPIRFLEIDVPLLRSYPSAGMCLPSRCLATSQYLRNKVEISMWKQRISSVTFRELMRRRAVLSTRQYSYVDSIITNLICRLCG